MPHPTTSLAALALALSLALASPALAGPTDAEPPAPSLADEARAKALVVQGEALAQAGRYDEATAALEEAWALTRRPVLLARLAAVCEAAGDLGAALEALDRYRAHAPAREQAELDARIEALAAAHGVAPPPPPVGRQRQRQREHERQR
jgi:tetratricopeptide (TPR) repeat protein